MSDNPMPALPYPEKTPQRVISDLGQISGDAYQHAGRYAGAVVLACFEQIGGLERMTDWASQNPTDFYTKLLPKMIQRSAQVDVNATVTIDEAISALESQPLEGQWSDVPAEPEPTEEAQFYDL